MANVELQNVWKIYGGNVEAVVDASWQCQDGEFFSILGPSGCGKSSTMRMIAGLEEITKGRILFDGEVINSLSPAERNIAMVFENWALYPHLSVYENIAFPLRVRKLSESEIDTKVRAAAAFLNLEPILKSKARRLSGGEMQRVSIGRAIVRNPSVLIMDEPISHLEASLRSRMRTELKLEIERLGITTLYITHDQVESMSMADRIAVMNFGRIQQIDTPLEIYSNPKNEFVGGFIGEPPMNFVQCELQQRDSDFFLESTALTFRVKEPLLSRIRTYSGNGQVKIGVRPEDLRATYTPAENASVGRVDFVEPQGDQTIVSVEFDSGQLLLSKVLGDVRAEPGEPVYLTVDQRHCHVFDSESGENVFYEMIRKNKQELVK